MLVLFLDFIWHTHVYWNYFMINLPNKLKLEHRLHFHYLTDLVSRHQISIELFIPSKVLKQENFKVSRNVGEIIGHTRLI